MEFHRDRQGLVIAVVLCVGVLGVAAAFVLTMGAFGAAGEIVKRVFMHF